MLKFFSRFALFGAIFIALRLERARRELVMFEQAGCAWCEAFDREIARFMIRPQKAHARRCAASIAGRLCRLILPSSKQSG